MATYNQQWPRNGWVLESSRSGGQRSPGRGCGRRGRRRCRPEKEFLTTLYQALLVLATTACCVAAGGLADFNPAKGDSFDCGVFEVPFDLSDIDAGLHYLSHISSENISCGDMSPTDPYLLLGGRLELNCTINPERYKGNLTAADIYFTAGTRRISPGYVTVLSPLSARLILPNVSEYSTRKMRFCCYVGPEDSKVLMGVQVVHVTKPLIKPVIQDCVIENWEVMRCTWLPKKQESSLQQKAVQLFWSNGTDIPNVNLDHIVTGNLDEEMTFLEKNHSTCPIKGENECKWPLRKDAMWPYTEGITVLVVALARSLPPPGTNRSMLDLDEQSDPYFINASLIVKPNPVAINILNQALSNVMIQWRPPVDDRKLTYELRLRSEWETPGDWKTVSLEEENEWRLKEPTPYTNYTISVRARPAAAGLWSEAATKTFPTPPGVPSRNPEVVIGSYESHNSGANQRNVLIHWKPLELQYRHGPKLNYYVQLYSDGNCLIKPTGFISPITKVVPHNDLFTYMNVTAHKTCSFNFSVRVENLLGLAQEKPQKITVTAVNTQFKSVEGMVVDAYNNSHIEVRWTVSETDGARPVSHTIYWCKWSYSNHMCQGQLQWHEVLMPQNSFTIVLEEGESYSGYNFAVSRNGAHISSGMVWSRCTYDKSERSSPPKTVNVSTSEGPESILVVWSANSCKQKTGYILHFTIYYCVTLGANRNCSGDVSQVQVPGELTSHVLKGLEPSLMYRVTVESYSLAGRSLRRSTPVYITTTAFWATSGVIAAITISVIIVFLLFIAGVTALVCNFRKCHSWFTGLRIDLPEKMSNGGVMRGTSTSSSQPLRLHSYGELDHHHQNHNSQQQQQHLFYNQQFSIESWSADSGNGSLSHEAGGGGGGGPGGLGFAGGGGSGSLPRRHSLSISDASDPDDVFNTTMNTTDGAVDVSGFLDGSTCSGGKDSDFEHNLPLAQQQQYQPQPQPQQVVTTYQIDKNKHPMNAEHANKNGYVKMGDNGVVAMFSKNSVPSLPKVVEEE